MTKIFDTKNYKFYLLEEDAFLSLMEKKRNQGRFIKLEENTSEREFAKKFFAETSKIEKQSEVLQTDILETKKVKK